MKIGGADRRTEAAAFGRSTRHTRTDFKHMQLVKPLRQNAPTGSCTKAPYAAPVISEYGSIRALTQSIGMNGMMDGGGMGMNRTNA